jgi:hypothetical protein
MLQLLMYYYSGVLLRDKVVDTLAIADVVTLWLSLQLLLPN